MSYTYTTLKTAIQDYTQNTETSFVKHLEDFIKNAEERILKNIQLSYFRKNQSGTTSNTNKYLAVPGDFLAPYSLSVTSSSEHIFLEFKDVSIFSLNLKMWILSKPLIQMRGLQERPDFMPFLT